MGCVQIMWSIVWAVCKYTVGGVGCVQTAHWVSVGCVQTTWSDSVGCVQTAHWVSVGCVQADSQVRLSLSYFSLIIFIHRGQSVRYAYTVVVAYILKL